MDINDIMQAVMKAASADPTLKKTILATADTAEPISAFCKLVRTMGYPLYEMELIDWGESNYAAMRRSTNGGGENSPALRNEEDYYDLFMTQLAAEK